MGSRSVRGRLTEPQSGHGHGHQKSSVRSCGKSCTCWGHRPGGGPTALSPTSAYDTGAFHSVGFWSVTDHTLDRALIGIGEQATVTFLAFAED